MIKIQLRIRNKALRAQPNVVVVMHCVLKNGEAFSSEPQTSNRSGIVWLEFNKAFAERIDMRSLRLQLSRNGQNLKHDMAQPERVNRGAFRVDVTLEEEAPGVIETNDSNNSVDSANNKQPNKPLRYVVRGEVKADDNRPVTDVYVRLFRKRIGSESELDKASVGNKGEYKLSYERNAESKHLDLIVRVYASPQSRRPLVSSPMVLQAKPSETVDFTLPRKLYTGQSLFDQIQDRLSGLMDEWADDVKDSSKAEDRFQGLTVNDAMLVARESGLAVEDVSQFIQANVLAFGASALIKQAVPAEPFFGLIRGGMKPNAVAFASLRDSELTRMLGQALKENWIDGLEPVAAVDAVRPLRVALLLQSSTPWLDLLRSGGVSNAQLSALVSLYLQSTKSLAGVIEDAIASKAIPNKKGAELLELTGVYALAGGDAKLLEGLLEELGVKSLRDLVALKLDDWRKVVRSHVKDLPDWVEGNSQAQRVNVFAQYLQDSIEVKYPTPFFTHRWLEDSKFKVRPIQRWLADHKDFEFTANSVGQVLNQAEVPADLARAERLFHIAPPTQRYLAFKALWLVGIERARDVLQLGESGFSEKMMGMGLSESTAHTMFGRAQRIASSGLLSLQTVPVRVPDSTDSGGGVTRVEPTVAALFGDKGGNGCDPCVSAFSPSAYLVDLLRFLDRANTQSNRSGKSGLELLFARRPDIQNLHLDCNNSHTPLPYIDLVNELLEHIVATSEIPFDAPNDWLVTSDLNLQTTRSAEQLQAHPEHLQVEAYNRLRNPLVASPWNLPYNLWADEVRTYLAQLGIDRTELIKVLRTDTDPLKILELAAERIGVTAAQMPVLSMPANTGAKRLLIWQEANPATSLKRVRAFMRRTGLAYDEIAQILSTQYVNPGPNQRDLLPADLSNLDDAEFGFVAADNNGLLDRFHRFVRLQKLTGWSSVELDALLQNVLSGDLNAQGIGSLGVAAQLHEEFGTSIEEISTWFGLLNTTGNASMTSLYERTFLDPAVIGVSTSSGYNLAEDVFRIVGDGASRELALVRSSITDKWLAQRQPEGWILHEDYTAVVLAGCQLSSADLLLMLSTTPSMFSIRQNKVALNLKHISLVYRVASIARALKISVSALLGWQSLSGVSISSDPDPLAALIWMGGVDRQVELGVDPEHLAYGFTGLSSVGLVPSAEELDAWMDGVRSDLLKTDAERALEVLPAQDQLRMWLAISPDSPAELAENVVDSVLDAIKGHSTPDATVLNLLEFFSPLSQDRLFGPEALQNVDERLLVASAEIPVDTSVIMSVTSLLEQELSDPGLVSEVLRLLVAVQVGAANANDAALLLDGLLPEINHNYLSGPVLTNAQKRYTDHWVKAPLVLDHLATFCQLEVPVVRTLLSFSSTNTQLLLDQVFSTEFLQEDATHLDLVKESLRRLHRQAVLAAAGQFDVRFLEFLNRHHAASSLIDLSEPGSIGLMQWDRSTTLFALNKRLADSTDLLGIMSDVADAVLTQAEVHLALAQLMEVNVADIDTLVTADVLGFDFGQSYLDVTKLERLAQACDYVRTCGLQAAQVVKFADPILNLEHANLAKAAVRANYDDVTWQSVSASLREGLRERQRDALLSFVRTRGGWDLSHEQAYAFYLLDVDMSACFETSRTKQAIASVQQFIQRIMLGLESEDLSGQVPLAFYGDDAKEWVWRKNYRVWEANLKVFAFPENWLEPELRDNKSPFFETLEQDLMQGELDNALAESAVTRYLEQLHEVSNLEIVGIYDDHSASLLYVIGRTSNIPHHYYLRTWKNREVWSPWQRIEIDIEGDHIIPVVYNNRLHIFWGMFAEQVDESKVNTTMQDYELDRLKSERLNLLNLWNEVWEKRSEPIHVLTDLTWGETHLPNILYKISGVDVDQEDWETIVEDDLEADGGLNNAIDEILAEKEQILNQAKYQEITLNWIVQDSNGWSGIKSSKGALLGKTGHELGEREPRQPDNYWFGVSFSASGGLFINLFSSYLDRQHNGYVYMRSRYGDVGYFSLDDCSGELQAVSGSAMQPSGSRIFDQGALVNTRHVVATEKDFGLGVAPNNRFLHIKEWHGSLFAEVFSSLNEAYVYATAQHQDLESAELFFLADSKRTYFAYSNDLEPNPTAPASHVLIEHQTRSLTHSIGQIQSRRRAGDITAHTAQPLDTLHGDALVYGGDVEEPVSGVAEVLATPTLHFTAHYHPFTCAFLRQIRRYGVSGLYAPDPKNQPGTDATDLVRQLTLPQRFDFDNAYNPNRELVTGDPKEVIDFGWDTAYGSYNWEVFFHTPMLVATRLSQQHRFEEAQKWFHYIFDPTEYADGNLANFWKIKPFYYAQIWGVSRLDLEEQLEAMETLDASSIATMIETWESNPFQPHAIARFRPIAYMRMTVMKYLDNLIAWGDSLFRRDSMESLNEATQLYVMARMILGERPVLVEQTQSASMSFSVQEYLDGHALRRLPESQAPHGDNPGTTHPAQGVLGVLEQFCLPFNDRMLDYWDTIDDRLFKIRHCLNIDGVFRKLPLFQPPIDPALLVKASAAGADLSAVLNNLSAPRPHYRFAFMLQKATEFAGIAQGLGSQLLAALEKQDAEQLAQLRADHEVALGALALEARELAVDESNKNLESLVEGSRTVEIRRDFYLQRERLSKGEKTEDTLRATASGLRIAGQAVTAVAGPTVLYPDVTIGGAGAMGTPLTISLVAGGGKASGALHAIAAVLSAGAEVVGTAAQQSGTSAARARRAEEWDHQVELAQNELQQFEKQIAAAEIRIALAEKELTSQKTQLDQLQEAQAYLDGKFTNQQLYAWLVTQLSSLYFQTYQLAYDLAKRAEHCYQHELGITDSQFVQFGYWDSMHKGLLAGERLQLDLKRMDSSYLDHNIRELELSKTFSLASMDPEALIRLRETGECFISLPEVLFDLDYPGHYFRRIKNVRLTLPAITGPYTSVSCTLTLLSDKYRKEAQVGEDENLFEWHVGAIQSIATSSGQNDSGLFQLDFRDERYLPFERAGAISSWKLNLPDPDLAQFDYGSISDVLLHVDFTARDGGQPYRSDVEARTVGALNSIVNEAAGLPLLVSLKQHFPQEWVAYQRAAAEGEPFDVELAFTTAHLPFYLRRRVEVMKSLKVIFMPSQGQQEPFVGATLSLNDLAPQPLALDSTSNTIATVFESPLAIDQLSIGLSSELVVHANEVDDILLVGMLEVTEAAES